MKHLTFYLLLSFMVGMCVVACAAPVQPEMNCERWLTETISKIESVPMEKRYFKILEELGKGCKAIPPALSGAASKSFKEKGPEAKKTLIEAAAPYFSTACLPNDPGIPADELLHICKKNDFPNGEFSSILKNIDAASYLFGKALQTELEKAGIYEPHGKRLLSNFFLSNALLRESM